MFRNILNFFVFLSLVGCSTLDQSFRLGAVTGALAGATSVYAAQSANGQTPSIDNVGVGASVGLGLGMIAAYFIHQSVAEDRESNNNTTEMHFGDLPPSPFIMPINQKRGGR